MTWRPYGGSERAAFREYPGDLSGYINARRAAPKQSNFSKPPFYCSRRPEHKHIAHQALKQKTTDLEHGGGAECKIQHSAYRVQLKETTPPTMCTNKRILRIWKCGHTEWRFWFTDPCDEAKKSEPVNLCMPEKCKSKNVEDTTSKTGIDCTHCRDQGNPKPREEGYERG